VTQTRAAVLLGAIPIIVGLIYYFGAELFAGYDIDAGGTTLLVALGLAMGFGMLVVLRGARDL
jgi:hypothetical protein